MASRPSNAPTEVILKLLKELDEDDYFEFQMVCRSWYRVAHRLFMEKVHLSDNISIEIFSNAVDNNTSYMQPIKQLKLGGGKRTGDYIDVEHAKQLLARVSGLKELYILDHDTFRTLITDSDVRKTIIEASPKLEKVHCKHWPNYSDISYFHLINNLKESLTYACISTNNILQSLSGFSHLETLNISHFRQLSTCQSMLPLFENQFNLKSLECSWTDADRFDFAEQFWGSKTQEERNFMIDKFSKLETLYVHRDSSFTWSSILFIAQYFIGVKELKYTIDIGTHWSNPKREVFCNEFMDYVSNMETSEIQILEINQNHMLACIPMILNKAFHNLPEGFHLVEKTLQLNMDNDPNRAARYGLSFSSKKPSLKQLERFVELRINGNNTMIDSIDTDVSNEVTSFNHCFNQTCPTDAYIPVFQRVLRQLPMVTKVSLQIERKLGFTGTAEEFPQVNKLELNSKHQIGKPDSFCKCLSMFPNINQLKLHRFCGIWKAQDKEYQVPLNNLRLGWLFLDVTPVINKTIEKQQVDYFVILITTANNQHAYQVSVDYLRITKLETEFDHSECMCVAISVEDLEYVHLYKYDYTKDKKLFESKVSLY